MKEIIGLAGTVVGYIAKTLKGNKDFKSFTSDFTSSAIGWLRPIFLTEDEKPTSILTDLKNNPDDILNQESAKIAIAKTVQKNPNGLIDLEELVRQINEIEVGLTSGYTVNQTHEGQGDNVGRDKIIR